MQNAHRNSAQVLGGAAVLDDDPKTVIDFEKLATALVGVGLIAARDNNKTSEDVGLKPTKGVT